MPFLALCAVGELGGDTVASAFEVNVALSTFTALAENEFFIGLSKISEKFQL